MELGLGVLPVRTFLLVATVLLSLPGTGLGMHCFICNSTLDHNCQEIFNHSSAVALNQTHTCDMWQPRFCIKVTGVWGGIVGTHRFCSSRDMGYQCQDIWYPDHDRMYRACVYTCSGDDCNGASRMSLSPLVLLLACWILHTVFRL